LNEKLEMPAPEPTAEDDGSSSKLTFKSLLLQKCQDQFKKGKLSTDEAEKEALSESEKETFEEEAMKSKKKFLGDIVFTTELYILSLLPSKVIVKACVVGLLNRIKSGDFTFVEPLHKLLNNVGFQLELNFQDEKLDEYRKLLNSCYDELRRISADPKMGKRDGFFIQDILELREDWVRKAQRYQRERPPNKSSSATVEASMKLTPVKKVTVESVSNLICSSVEEFLDSDDRNEAFECFNREVIPTKFAHMLMPQMLKYAIDNNLPLDKTEKVAFLLCEYPKFKSSEYQNHVAAMKELPDILESVDDATDSVINIFSTFMSIVLQRLNFSITPDLIECLLELKDRDPFCSSKEKRKYGVSALYFASTVQMVNKRNPEEGTVMVSKAKSKDNWNELFNDEEQCKEVCKMYGISDLMGLSSP